MIPEGENFAGAGALCSKRILIVLPAEARALNMAVNQRVLALSRLAPVVLLACYPDVLPREVADAVSVCNLPVSKWVPAGAARLAAFWLEVSAYALLNRLTRRRFDLVYTFQDTSAVAGLILRGAGSGWVVDALDDPALELRNAIEQRRTIKAWALRARDKVFRALVSRADLVVTIGCNVYDPLPRLLASEYGVRPDHLLPLVQAIDLGRQPSLTSGVGQSTVHRIFYVGWVSPLRGVGTVIEAARRLRDRGVNVEVRLAGHLKAHDQAGLQQAESRDPGLIRHLGVLPGERIAHEIADAAVCVCPFPERRELLPVQPVKVLEYLAAGKPVVASRLPGTSAIIEDGVNGLLVEPDDAGQLADAIGKVLADPLLASALGEAARRRVLQFDVTVVNHTLQQALSPWL